MYFPCPDPTRRARILPPRASWMEVFVVPEYDTREQHVCVSRPIYRGATGMIGIRLASPIRGKPRSGECPVATCTISGTAGRKIYINM